MVEKRAVRRAYDELGRCYGTRRDASGLRSLEAVLDATDPDRVLDAGVEMAWAMAGVEATRGHLRTAGFTVEREWGAADSLEDADEEPWAFLEGRLAGRNGRRSD